MTNDADQASTAAAPATGRRPALTREQILTAAVAIIDAEGVEALTMRRLGQALDRDPMAIYRHAADKDALLDGVVEHVAAELVTPREPDQQRGRELGSGPAPHRAHVPPGRPGPPPRGAAAADPATVRPARPATPGHAATPRGATRAVQHRRVRPTRRAARRPAVHRIPLRPRPARTAGTDPQPRRDRRPAPPRTAPAALTQFPRLRSLATALATYDGAAELDEGLDHRPRRPAQPTPHLTHPTALQRTPDRASPDRTCRRGGRPDEVPAGLRVGQFPFREPIRPFRSGGLLA